jgi:lipopolysaccharide export system protein LptA
MNKILISLVFKYIKRTSLFSLLIIVQVIANAQPVKKIEIVNSDILRVDEIHGPDVQILIGNVVLKHDSALMFCDSAYYNTYENNFTAFGKIHIQNPTEDMIDTVHLWGESLNYIGKEKLALVRKNVVLKKDSMVLYTQDLDYDISRDIGKYVTGGRTINGEDTLVSQIGYFYANEDLLFFKENVKIFNPKYTIYSDTLKHNTKKKISYILGPTNIISTDTTSSFLYCENGTYNHARDIAQFQKNAYLVHDKKTLKGDSLYYDRKKKTGKAYNNVFAIDSTQNAILKGNYGEYDEKTERSLLTKRAVFIQIQKNDSLFLHADTLLSLKDTLMTKSDTTIYSIIKGFHKVKIFKADFQAKCDSLVYSTIDSTIELHREPVLWSGKNQITAKFIKIFTKNNEISELKMYENSLIVSQSDTIRFDQIKGKNMVAFVIDDTLRKIDVNEDAAAIYFGREKEKLIGVNKITSKNMVIHLDSNQVDRIWFYEKPDGTLYPPDYLSESELKFDNFEWNDFFRPKTMEDIFIWKSKMDNEENKQKQDKVKVEKIESEASKNKESKSKGENEKNKNKTDVDRGKEK